MDAISLVEAEAILRQQLMALYDEGEAGSMARWVLESISGLGRPDYLLQQHRPMTEEQSRRLEFLTNELLRYRPLQYVLGESYFYNLKLRVDERVLIPRPETEELVDWILREHRSDANVSAILDIGTGSGCIALALKKNMPAARIVAVDISEPALELAAENGADLGLQVEWQKADILQGAHLLGNQVFDLIVSNPPYIAVEEKSGMSPNVLQYEPHNALFVTNRDPQQFYKAIELFARQHLRRGGNVYLELHRDYAPDTQQYYIDRGWTTELRYDMAGNARMLRACGV
jgi:release factor glutamine methyltransferase